MFALLPLRYVTIQVDASWRQDVAAVFASDFSSAWPRSVVELIRRLVPGFLGWELDFFAIQMCRRADVRQEQGMLDKQPNGWFRLYGALQPRAFAHGGELLYEVDLSAGASLM